MPGAKGHSGRRPSANRDEGGRFGSGGDEGRVKLGGPGDAEADPSVVDDVLDFPDKLDTVDEIRAAARWVWRQQCRGIIDARTGDALNTTLKTALASIRTAHGLEEMEQLRDLVRRMENAAGVTRKRGDEERHSSVAAAAGTTTTLGRRLAPSDDKH